jgi:hypothetical protein
MAMVQPRSSTGLSTLARDLFRRHLDRSSRPLRVLRGRKEFLARKAAARQLDVDEATVQGLAATGFTPLGRAVIDPDAIVATSIQKLEHAQSLPQRGNKPFFSQLLNHSDLTHDSVFLRFALNESLLRLVARYLRCAPFLNSVELLYSKPLATSPMASQLWHRDRRDLAIIKVFVYATDVEMENGPLTVLPRADSATVPDYLPHYLSDAQISRYVNLEHAVALTGPRGTTWMVDSENCYHLGSRCQRPRLAYVVYYDSGFGYRPRETDWRHVVEDTGWSPLQRYALGLA